LKNRRNNKIIGYYRRQIGGRKNYYLTAFFVPTVADRGQMKLEVTGRLDELIRNNYATNKIVSQRLRDYFKVTLGGALTRLPESEVKLFLSRVSLF